jgi:radical SAM protein with 4Fe4S-binding SPASM domain
MFGNQVSTSLDFPNRHRRIAGGTAADYERIWLQNLYAVRAAGIHVGVIAIPSPETLELGAERFYKRFVDELEITDFQINTPFAGGPPSAVKQAYPLDPRRLGRFLVELADIWIDRGCPAGVKLGPFDELLEYFSGGPATLPCFWRENCAREVVSYPKHRFGNILGEETLAQLLQRSPARERLLRRPSELVRREDCIWCEHLGICHGGCPIRAFTCRGQLNEKDPYCDTYRMVFDYIRGIASCSQRCGS